MKELALPGASQSRCDPKGSSWYQALTLSERLTSLRSQPDYLELVHSERSELAERRLRKWRTQSPFDQDTYFADRLAQDGIAEDELAYLLGESAMTLQERYAITPTWLSKLQKAFEASEVVGQLIITAPDKHQAMIEMLKPLEPLLLQSLHRLRAGIERLQQVYPYVPFEVSTIGDLCLPNLLALLFPSLNKTLTLELNIARMHGKLSGETPEERFRSFVQQLCEPSAMLALLEDYPVLARQLITTTEYWLAYTLEILEHLSVDWKEICETLVVGDDPGLLTEITFGAGDTHCQGRSVVQLRFSSGFRLVYKPKSLATEVHFQTLLSWLNERGKHPAFRLTKVIDKGDYGWSEFVQASGCTSEEELERFYQRQGGYLALLYALMATDLHFENLIASGEHPVLIDLETLFQPDLFFKPEDAATLPLGVELARSSVLRTHLLPVRFGAHVEEEGIDISGLSGKGGLTPRPVARLENPGTDQMRMTRQRVRIESKQNRPTLNDTEVDPLRYLTHIAVGFTAVYRTLLEHRDAFLNDILPLFTHDKIRILARSTKAYMTVLQDSWHPTLLHRALDRDRFLDRLWMTVRQYRRLARLIAAEQEDLREGDIPLFTTYLDDRHLYSSRGQCIPDFFDTPCLELVRQRIVQLSEVDLDRQLWLLKASFTTLTLGSGKGYWRLSQLRPLSEQAAPERFLSAARLIADRLTERVIRREKEVGWLGLHLINEQHWAIAPVGIDLYTGCGGICLFLAYLGTLTKEASYTVLARQVLEHIHQQLELVKDNLTTLGAFNGWGAFLYLYTHLGVLWHDYTLLEKCEALIEQISLHIEQDEQFDVLAGAAGCILSLLNLYQVTSSSQALTAAIRCGDHLLQRAQRMQRGLGWSTLTDTDPLAGFSHGAAGIALSLLKLSAISSQERFRTAALEALEYERSLFSPEQQNWLDLRNLDTTSGEGQQMVAWCHGAPGVGLARLLSLDMLDDAIIREEINTALTTTLAHGFGLNHSLCHGDLGNLELLLTASQTLNNTQYHAEVERLGTMILQSVETQGWCTGVPLGVEVPGLMTGLSGIGYGLLRLARPDLVPSVLALAAPLPLAECI